MAMGSNGGGGGGKKLEKTLQQVNDELREMLSQQEHIHRLAGRFGGLDELIDMCIGDDLSFGDTCCVVNPDGSYYYHDRHALPDDCLVPEVTLDDYHYNDDSGLAKLTIDWAKFAPFAQKESSQSQTAAVPKASTKNRCEACRKKVGLLGIACRCGGTYCGAHRHESAYSCAFDYKTAGREQIALQNPLVVTPKITRI